MAKTNERSEQRVDRDREQDHAPDRRTSGAEDRRGGGWSVVLREPVGDRPGQYLPGKLSFACAQQRLRRLERDAATEQAPQLNDVSSGGGIEDGGERGSGRSMEPERGCLRQARARCPRHPGLDAAGPTV